MTEKINPLNGRVYSKEYYEIYKHVHEKFPVYQPDVVKEFGEKFAKASL